jgi:hypothetical protein
VAPSTLSKKYLAPSLLILDELGYLPIDKHGADLLFQVISQRYERGSIIITSNRAYKQGPEIFNNYSTLTSAILDRLLHHADPQVIEGKSYRMKDHLEPQQATASGDLPEQKEILSRLGVPAPRETGSAIRLFWEIDLLRFRCLRRMADLVGTQE